jgi:hypothetical protein
MLVEYLSDFRSQRMLLDRQNSLTSDLGCLAPVWRSLCLRLDAQQHLSFGF